MDSGPTSSDISILSLSVCLVLLLGVRGGNLVISATFFFKWGSSAQHLCMSPL